MPLYLGIDGGGTKTTCAIGTDLEILATATGSGCNVIRLGESAARAGLEEAILLARGKGEVDLSQVTSVCIGAAGASHPRVQESLKTMLREMLPQADLMIVGDMEIAWQAALGEGPGVVVIAGTGSIAYGHDAAGRTARAGGWGFEISDEGSGQWIGRTAVSAVMRAHDAGRSTTLADRIVQTWRLAALDELVRQSNAAPTPNFSELFPVVQRAADDHDELASEILHRAGEQLAALAVIVLRRLWTSNQRVRIGVTGGVFAHSRQVRLAFHRELRLQWPNAGVCFKIAEPVLGALQLARKMSTVARTH
jgi:N-acetylglucosamine kinase-like BadF-type ATPase